MKIGQFIRLTQLSRKALRLYEKLDILKPVLIDPESGYRFYADEQIELARLIRLLRQMEMPLALISKFVSAEPKRAVQILDEFTKEQARRAEQINQTAYLVRKQLAQENIQMTFEIKIKDVPAKNLACHVSNVKIGTYQEHIGKTLRLLHDHIINSGANIDGDPICLYHGPVNEDADGPVEICWPFVGDVASSAEITLRQMPAHKLAYHHAPLERSRFPEIVQVWDAVIDFARENGYETFPPGLACYEIWPEDTTVAVGWPFIE